MSDYKFKMDVSIALALFFRFLVRNQHALPVWDMPQTKGIAAVSAMSMIRPKRLIKKNTMVGAVSVTTLVAAPLLIQNMMPVSLVDYSYDSSWTHDCVLLDVKLNRTTDQSNRIYATLSNDPIEVIYEDDHYTVVIPDNGDVEVFIDDEKVLEQSIENIDKEGPEVALVGQDDLLEVRFEDTISGVDWSSISLTDHLGKEVQYHINNSTLIFQFERNHDYTISGQDIAGNKFESHLNYHPA